jgi:uncharacterized membrane protein YgcG
LPSHLLTATLGNSPAMKSDRRSSLWDQESTMTKYAKTLCSLAITAATLATFSLSSNEAFARSGVVRRVAAPHATRMVNKARPSPFVRGKLNSYAASNLRNSKNVSWAKHSGEGNSRLLTEGKGHGHDGDKNKGQRGDKEYGSKDNGHKGDKDYGNKDNGHKGDKEYGNKDNGHKGDKEYGSKDNGHKGDKEGKEYGDKGQRGDGRVEVRDHRGDKNKDGGNVRDHRGDKDKNGGKERPLGGQQAGGQQGGGQQGGGGSGFPDLSSLGSMGSGGGSAPSSSPADASSASPASTTDSSNCTSHHTWRNGQRVLIQVCPDA